MAEADLRGFIHKVAQLQAFIALSERLPELRHELAACGHHQEVVSLARRHGFEIGRRWGEPQAPAPAAAGNLLAGPCPPSGQERSTLLIQQPQYRLELIHSCQAVSPDGFWYDQPEHEWVCLLQGSAVLQIEGEPAPVALSRGDQLELPPHRRHRLVATDPDPGTVWLALFSRPGAAPG